MIRVNVKNLENFELVLSRKRAALDYYEKIGESMVARQEKTI